MVANALLSNPASTAAYFLLMAAIASLWTLPKPTAQPSVAFSFLGTALLAAYFADRITLVGVLVTLLFGFACFSFYRVQLTSLPKAVLGLVVIAFALLLGMHKLPGFKNWLVLSNLSVSADAMPVQLYLNFDKPLIGLYLMAFGLHSKKAPNQWRELFRATLPIMFSATLVLLGLSKAAGYVKLDLKWFEFSWLWLLVNLIFTCVAEESFFRGFIQNFLTQKLQRWKFGPVCAWVTASVLFGLVHLHGGWTYVCLATVAGLFYGYAYLKTQKIESSILVHFSVNAIHFLAFTYPALRFVK